MHTSASPKPMSALAPKAYFRADILDVRFVPGSDTGSPIRSHRSAAQLSTKPSSTNVARWVLASELSETATLPRQDQGAASDLVEPAAAGDDSRKGRVGVVAADGKLVVAQRHAARARERAGLHVEVDVEIECRPGGDGDRAYWGEGVGR